MPYALINNIYTASLIVKRYIDYWFYVFIITFPGKTGFLPGNREAEFAYNNAVISERFYSDNLSRFLFFKYGL